MNIYDEILKLNTQWVKQYNTCSNHAGENEYYQWKQIIADDTIIVANEVLNE